MSSAPSGAPSGAPTESPEEKKLAKAIEIICKVAKEGEKSGFAVDTVAEAAYFFRTSVLTAPFRMAWNTMPALMQREFAAANQTAAGKFLMDYLPMLNLRFYFTPGLLVAGLAECGIVSFKMNSEEEAAMTAEIGEDASEEAKVAYRSNVEEKVIKGITMPFEGGVSFVAGTAGSVVGTVVPEAKPVVMIAKGADVVNNAKNGYFVQVRERVHALELEAAKAKAEAEKNAAEVPAEQETEHHQIAQADPEAVEDHPHVDHGGKIPPLTFDPNTTDGSYYGPVVKPANNNDDYDEAAAA